jgi:SulP family sulfate permease
MNTKGNKLALFFQPRTLLPNLVSGLIFGLLNIAYAIALAAFIFTGDLSNHISIGVSAVLISCFLTGLAIAAGSSIPGVISTPKGYICAIIALIATSVSTHTLASPHQFLPTIVAAIMISSILTGIFLLTLGLFQIGNHVRLIPYPVIGGCFAGAGLLIVKGSFSIMLGVQFNLEHIQLLLQYHKLILWGPGFIFAVLLFGLERRYQHFSIMPVLLLGSIGLFYLLLLLTNTSIVQAKGAGLLFSDFSAGKLFPPLDLIFFNNVNFFALSEQVGNIITIVFLSTISALLVTSLIEVGTEKHINLEKDLKVAGIANIATGLLGGVVGFHTASDTVLSYKFGAKRRLSGIVYAVICGASILIGPSIITYFPKPVMGGLVLFLGISILTEWVYDAWFKLPKTDYFLVIIILVVVGSLGYLNGVGLGIIVAAILFIINYSRINVVKHELSGEKYYSKVERAASHKKLLKEKGEQIYILILQGYIFFGTAARLLNQIKQRLESTTKPRVRFVILDFRLVSNIDSSAVNSFVRLKQLSFTQQVNIVFANLNSSIRQQLQHIEYFGKEDTVCCDFPDLDHALEWCEEQMLIMENAADIDHLSLSQQLTDLFPNKEVILRFMNYLKHMKVPAGYYLFREGDASEHLYFIESGNITILLELGDGKNVRLQTMGSGTVIGEMGLYSKKPRSATAIVEEPSSLYSLSYEAFNSMQKEDPEVASSFHQFVARLLADRIVITNEEIRTLIT